ncbi:type 1 glutamine amidotransferase domain-containing protein [Chitinophaga pinensis]|uniref:ThiJ/PfpI domain protein n=1 Tax=Chitinophaga pinensis (strain ATCC 43595 / DSM 2588 / LMG 13176 / NBRC 15968 / NCIMB 11800 / UQM 2034) TaxID=485918 RepID=A0A979G7J9_CHIPD|nr:type 1 glutamine amidotransferase domain-containing protein [Chitinophaga pinensis]ACU62231.1 ThiJ/PfpI domain protein [Chitinophaga pinensis DSM 2588]
MSKKILFIVSNASFIGPNNRQTGVFLDEVAHPYVEFDDAHYQIDFASITGGVPAVDNLTASEESSNARFIKDGGLAKMQHNRKLSDVDTSGYDAVFVPGGLAPMVDMPEDPLLKKVIAGFYDSGKIVGAVCHGPVSLLNVRLNDGSYLIAGKNITSFTNEEEDNYAKNDVPFELETALTNQGAKFHAAAPWSSNSIADGRLVTGQNPASAKGVAQKMIALLGA